MRGPVRLPISVKTSAIEGSQTPVEVPYRDLKGRKPLFTSSSNLV